METVESNLARLKEIREARIRSEIQTAIVSEQRSGEDVISEIQQYLSELKKNPQNAYPQTGSE
jgi:phage-related protein